MMISYKDVTTDLGGQKRIMSGSITQEYFKSRHRKECLKDGKMFSRNIKRNGVILSICLGCGNECNDNAYQIGELI